MKICGVVSDLNEAKEFEEIVKVFLIEQRINNLSTVGRSKKIKNPNSDFLKKLTEKYKSIKNSEVKNFHRKNGDYNKSN